MFMHGHDSAYLGNATPSYETLPAGAQAPTFNGGFLEFITFSTRKTSRCSALKRSTSALSHFHRPLPEDPGDYGNVIAYDFATVGTRSCSAGQD